METHQEALDTYPLMRRALDLLPDGVLIIGANREVLYLNAAFERLWRIPSDIMRQGDRAMLEHVLEQLDDPEAFIDLVEKLYHSSDPSEDQIAFDDGRVFHRRSVALEAGNSGFSRIWIFSDVTEAWSARVDPLTGLLNRRAYARELPAFLSASTPKAVKAFSILDVDHFKPYNDIYGHAAGDAVLEELGRLLLDAMAASSDQAYRIGGEEFAITSFHSDPHVALRFHQNILRSVTETMVSHVGNPPHGIVTVSMGLGIFSGDLGAEYVFDEVDRALYRAKKLGRNQIALAKLSSSETDQANHRHIIDNRGPHSLVHGRFGPATSQRPEAGLP